MGTTSPTDRQRTTIATALFSGTQQRVLGVLFGRPDRSFYTSEIFELARVGRGAVQRELARLEKSGLIQVQQIGNQKHYQANQDSPVFEELRSIVRKTSGLADPLASSPTPADDETNSNTTVSPTSPGSW